jgi:HK97 family phage portal protein
MESWVDSSGFVNRPTADTATHLGPVFSAIRHIVDYGSTLPVDCYRRSSETQRVQVATPQLLSRLDAPGGIGMEQWFGQFFYALAVHGNAVGWNADFDGYGYPTSVIWLKRTDWSYSETEKQWYVLGAPVPFANVTHAPWIVPPGCRLGLSPIEHYAATVKAGISAQEYADMRRGGGIPPLDLANSEKVIDPAQAEAISDRLTERLAKGRPFVHGRDWTLTANTMPANQTQFIETLKLTANQIAAAYGLDPTVVGGEAGNSQEYTTEERRQIRRAADMRPYLIRAERTVNRLLPNKQYMQFNVDATMRIDIETRTKVVGAKLADGRMNINEARALEDEPGIGPQGDRYNVPAPGQKEPATRGEQP